MSRQIDETLKQAGDSRYEVDAGLLGRIADMIGSDLRPVRPLAPPWLLTTGLVLIGVAVAMVGSMRLGFFGFEKLSRLERGLIFTVLGVLIWVAASSFVTEKIPGSRCRVDPRLLLGGGSAVLLAVFAFLFRDTGTEHFVSQGLTCLTTGLLFAIPMGLGSGLLLRRGFAVNSTSAGMVAGTLAGLAGITMLELHCPNFKVLHVMVWHVAVVLVSGGVGAWLAGLIRRLNLSRP